MDEGAGETGPLADFVAKRGKFYQGFQWVKIKRFFALDIDAGRLFI
jgi:hypothetical protein